MTTEKKVPEATNYLLEKTSTSNNEWELRPEKDGPYTLYKKSKPWESNEKRAKNEVGALSESH